MAKSKSQERREAAQKAAEGQTPAWKQNQQKETTSIDSEQRQDAQEKVSKAKVVKIKMRTSYRDIAKAGDTVEFDIEKAAELVRLNRAEYVK